MRISKIVVNSSIVTLLLIVVFLSIFVFYKKNNTNIRNKNNIKYYKVENYKIKKNQKIVNTIEKKQKLFKLLTSLVANAPSCIQMQNIIEEEFLNSLEFNEIITEYYPDKNELNNYYSLNLLTPDLINYFNNKPINYNGFKKNDTIKIQLIRWKSSKYYHLFRTIYIYKQLNTKERKKVENNYQLLCRKSNIYRNWSYDNKKIIELGERTNSLLKKENSLKQKRWIIKLYSEMIKQAPACIRNNHLSKSTLLKSFSVGDIYHYRFKQDDSLAKLAYDNYLTPEIINYLNNKPLNYNNYKRNDIIKLATIIWYKEKVIHQFAMMHNYKNLSKNMKRKVANNYDLLYENSWYGKDWFYICYYQNVYKKVGKKFRGKEKRIIVDLFDVTKTKTFTVKTDFISRSKLAKTLNEDPLLFKYWNPKSSYKKGEKIKIKELSWKPYKTIASFYGTVDPKEDNFHGKKMANGEIYNKWSFIVAHRFIPLHEKLKIKNLKNGKIAYVEVTDKGPFTVKNKYYSRGIDLSLRTAKHLGGLEDGLIPVQITPIN